MQLQVIRIVIAKRMQFEIMQKATDVIFNNNNNIV